MVQGLGVFGSGFCFFWDRGEGLLVRGLGFLDQGFLGVFGSGFCFFLDRGEGFLVRSLGFLDQGFGVL